MRQPKRRKPLPELSVEACASAPVRAYNLDLSWSPCARSGASGSSAGWWATLHWITSPPGEPFQASVLEGEISTRWGEVSPLRAIQLVLAVAKRLGANVGDVSVFYVARSEAEVMDRAPPDLAPIRAACAEFGLVFYEEDEVVLPESV